MSTRFRSTELSPIPRLLGWLGLILMCCFTGTVFAGQVTLAWDPSSSSDIGGYKVVYGQSSGAYTSEVDVGKQTSSTMANLDDSKTYYFAVRAYNADKTVESANSNEVSKLASATTPPPSTVLPKPWINMDIGNVGQVGSASYTNGTFTVNGSGDDIWNNADAFQFVYQSLNGDGSVVARVVSVGNTAQWAKTGVMIRENLDANARNAFVLVSPDTGGVFFQYRATTGGTTVERNGAVVSAPYWVKLARAGNTFTAYQSANGTTWTQIGSTTLSMAASVYVGLAVTSTNNSALNTSLLDGVSVQTSGTSPSSTVAYTFTSQPSGLSLNYDGVSRVTPFTVDAEVGSQHAIGAPASQSNYTFNSWSDGGSATHTITIGASSQTLTANYVVATPAPTADFSANQTTGSAPLTVSFSNQSSGSVNTWAWSFGDGGVSSTASPSHTYSNAGTYSVSLTVTGPGGSNTATKTNYITVKEAAPTASFTASPSSGQAPLLVTFIVGASTGGSINSYDWTFSDNTTGSGSRVVKTFDAGNYTATLKVTGPGGSATATQKITATAAAVAPVANFSASPTSGTVPLTVQFADTSTGTVTAWSWDFGDGTTPSTQQSPSHTYATTGTYTVKLTTTNSAGSNVKTQNNYITVSPSTSGSTGKFQQSGTAPNLVVMEAEHFNDNTAQSGHAWQATTSYGDYSGASALQALPEDHTRIDSNYAATSPRLDYQVNFVKTGTHYVWIRALGPSWSADSLHVGLDGQEVASTARLSQLNPLGSWVWSKMTHDGTVATLNVTSPGVHIINVWMRESGTLLDKLVLTPDANYTPSGLGPDETLGQSTGKIPDSPTTGLVAAYGFEEGSGSTVADRSGQGNHGVISGASWSSRGKFGNALYFNSNDWVTVNDSASLDLTAGMTLEAWVYPTSSMSGWSCVLLKEQTNGLVYSLQANSDANQPSFGIRIGNADQNLYGGPWLATYQWVHLAATYDGTTQRLYVNGSEVANRRISGPIQTSNGVLRIGGNSIWGQYFNGRIDEVRIYNRALNASEIQSDMNTALQQ